MNKTVRKVLLRTAHAKKKGKKILIRLIRLAESKPLTSFFITLAVISILIAGGNFLRKPIKEEKVTPLPTIVETYKIGSAPRLTFDAQIEKTGIVKINAQTGGIVKNIHVKEGQKVTRGKILISLSSNYRGANAPSLSRKLAQLTYQNIKNTFDDQKDLIEKQREIAERTDANADELRLITSKSLEETRSLISLNNDILLTIEDNLKDLETTNVGSVNDDLIFQTKQLKSQFLAANNQLKSALRSTEYQENENNNPAQLSNLAKDIAKKQLELQKKALELSLETSKIQLQLAQAAESLMFPSAFFAGTVEKVHVRRGQIVVPGTPLVTLSGNEKNLKAVVLVPQIIAKTVSKLEPATMHINGRSLEITPTYISQEATDGQLYSITFTIPQKYQDNLTDLSFIQVDIPVGYADTSKTIPFVPIDSVYQTQKEAFVFVVENGIAQSRKITLGTVQGRFVEVKTGLLDKDEVILNRNVVAGEKIEIKKI